MTDSDTGRSTEDADQNEVEEQKRSRLQIEEEDNSILDINNLTLKSKKEIRELEMPLPPRNVETYKQYRPLSKENSSLNTSYDVYDNQVITTLSRTGSLNIKVNTNL